LLYKPGRASADRVRTAIDDFEGAGSKGHGMEVARSRAGVPLTDWANVVALPAVVVYEKLPSNGIESVGLAVEAFALPS
jgi:hypothetical protein